MNGLKCCLRDVKGSDGISMTPEACFIRFGMPEKSCVVYLRDLDTMGADKEEYETWEIVFELRIRRSRYIRIYADVLVVTDRYVFSLEFKMKDKIDPDELSQAAKYSPYLEVIFGPEYEVIPVLVLTRAEDLYRYEKFGGTTAEVPVCSGDMLFNVLDEYQGIMKESDER